jgi:hypothetical protein
MVYLISCYVPKGFPLIQLLLLQLLHDGYLLIQQVLLIIYHREYLLWEMETVFQLDFEF